MKVTAAGLAERNDARHASHSNEPYRPQPAHDGGSSTSISAMAHDAAEALIGPLVPDYRSGSSSRLSRSPTRVPLPSSAPAGALMQSRPPAAPPRIRHGTRLGTSLVTRRSRSRKTMSMA